MAKEEKESIDSEQAAQESLVFRIGKWEIRVGSRNYTIGYREDPEQRYLYQMQFVATLKEALKNLSGRILVDKFINNNLPDTQRTLGGAIDMIEAHDAWFEELVMGH